MVKPEIVQGLGWGLRTVRNVGLVTTAGAEAFVLSLPESEIKSQALIAVAIAGGAGILLSYFAQQIYNSGLKTILEGYQNWVKNNSDTDDAIKQEFLEVYGQTISSLRGDGQEAIRFAVGRRNNAARKLAVVDQGNGVLANELNVYNTYKSENLEAQIIAGAKGGSVPKTPYSFNKR